MRFQDLEEGKSGKDETLSLPNELYSFSDDVVHVRAWKKLFLCVLHKTLEYHLPLCAKNTSFNLQEILDHASPDMDTGAFLSQSEFFALGHILNYVRQMTQKKSSALFFNSFCLDIVYLGRNIVYFLDIVFPQVYILTIGLFSASPLILCSQE